MAGLSSKQRYFWIGFVVIVALYSIYNLYLVDVSYYPNIPRKIRHIGKFVAILTIYGTGTFALKKYTADWMMYIWHTIHIIIISLLLVIGLYNWFVGELSVPVHNIANTLFEFLTSPVIYIGAGILNSKFGKER